MALHRIDASNGPWPLHNGQAARAAEQAALALHAPHVLMARAGLAVARLALAVAPHAQRVQLWCGPGNNGGDGLVAARHLHQAGRQVQVLLLGDPARRPADAAHALQQAQDTGVPLQQGQASRQDPQLVIDALLGIGATRAPQGEMADAVSAISAINADGCPIIAVDLPSGLHADTGMQLGAAAVRALHTLSLLTLKPGCFTGLGRDHAGIVWLDSLDTTVDSPASATLAGLTCTALRMHASHKGSFGDVTVVGGAPGMVGAAWLAARAASAAGAGRVYCSLLDSDATQLDPAHPELMARRNGWQAPPATLARSTVVCGCGGGDAVAAVLPALLSHAARLVLDADALNAVAADSALQALLRQRAARGRHSLLTPHPLEAARLLGTSTAGVQHDRIGAAQTLAERLQCAVLLKGSGSVVAAPQTVPRINPSGNAALASAGTGDVLGGWAAGLWAQHDTAAAADIGAAAAWQHGRAADLWPDAARGAPLRASALIEQLALRRWQCAETLGG